MADEDNSTEHTTNESDERGSSGGENEGGSGGEDVESYSRESGTSVESTTADSSVDESSASDSSPEIDQSSDSWADSDEASTEPSMGSSTESESSDSTIDIETPHAQTATGTGTHSTMADTRASVLAAASPSEEATLRRVRAVSQLLDEAFRIPGTNYRIGIDPILGILPVAGDAIPTALSFYPIVEAYRVGVPKEMLAKMLALVAIDATVGSIPVVGTLFDAVWKANKWNLRMLERHIEERSAGN